MELNYTGSFSLPEQYLGIEFFMKPLKTLSQDRSRAPTDIHCTGCVGLV